MNQRHMPAPLRLLPDVLQRYILHFEASIEDAVKTFGDGLPAGMRVLDAGAGEGQYASHFERHRYIGVDLGVGDADWSYTALDAVADLAALPFADATFDAVINIVTLEHVREPKSVLCELGRVLRPGGQLLLVTPHEWEEHQQPYDYYRYTRYGLAYLLGCSGFSDLQIVPVGRFFRLHSRRLLNSVQIFGGPLALLLALVFGPPAMLLPLLDSIDKKRNFTLGHICTARRRSSNVIGA